MATLANMANPTVWIVIAVVALLLFGGNKIPEMMHGIGRGVVEFKKGMRGDDELHKDKESKAL